MSLDKRRSYIFNTYYYLILIYLQKMCKKLHTDFKTFGVYMSKNAQNFHIEDF